MSETKFNVNRHVWLYAKHHYKRSGDTVEAILSDLRALLSDTYLISGMTDGDIFSILRHMLTDHWEYVNNKHIPYQWMERVDPEGHDALVFPNHYGKTYRERFLNVTLSDFANTSVDKIDGELGEPDPSLLPFSDLLIKHMKEKGVLDSEKTEFTNEELVEAHTKYYEI